MERAEEALAHMGSSVSRTLPLINLQEEGNKVGLIFVCWLSQFYVDVSVIKLIEQLDVPVMMITVVLKNEIILIIHI